MNEQSNTYIQHLINQLTSKRTIIVYDIFKPRIDKELSMIGLEPEREIYESNFSQKRHRVIVASWEYKLKGGKK